MAGSPTLAALLVNTRYENYSEGSNYYISSCYLDMEKLKPNYPLPDPLILLDGPAVSSSELWYKKSNQEIMELDSKKNYGTPPASFGLES